MHNRLVAAVDTRLSGLGEAGRLSILPVVPPMLFWLGPIAEQALVVNVRGRGLVVVTAVHPARNLPARCSAKSADLRYPQELSAEHL